MWLGLLGSLSVRDNGAEIHISAPKQRVVLAAMLRRANQVVSFDELAGVLWAFAVPPTARVTLRNHVKNLRQAAGPAVSARIITRNPGYLINVRETELDLLHFTSLCAAGAGAAAAGRWEEADAVLGGALALWRGAPLEDIPSEVLRSEEVPRLEQLRLQAQEGRIDAALHLGRHHDLVPELRALVAQHRVRERLHRQLMLALYRSGHRADALAAYREARQILADERGAGPGPELRQLHQRMLSDDPGLAAGNPKRSLAVPIRPRQVQAGTPDFVGRAPELAALYGMLDAAAGETVVISAVGGTAGVGKTTLATHFAHQVADRFPDGLLHVNLRGFDPSRLPVTPDEAIRGFLDALQVPPASIPAGPAAQAALYRSLTAGRRMLVLLDNARDGEQVRPLLPGSPGSLVLVTSRSELPGLVAEGARPLGLGLFSDTEALDLLTRRIGAARVAAEPDAARDLTRLCARLPLALAITAARANARPGFPLAALAAELRDADDRLDALDTGEQIADVRAVFSWSYHGLPAAPARMFRLLGLHPGPDITAAAAASLAATTADQARGLLHELTRGHLLAEPAPGRYALHDLLRVYATELAQAEDGEQPCREATRRLLDHYLHTAHDGAHLMQPQRGTLPLTPARPGVTPEPLADHEQALAWFQAEHGVLLGVVALAAETGFPACAWQLPWCMATFLDWQGHWHDWAATQRIALAAVTPGGDAAASTDEKAAQAIVGRAFAAACIRLADYDRARVHLTACLRIYRELGDQGGQSRIHRDLGSLSEYQERYDEALGHVEQALRLSRAVGDRDGEAFALSNVSSYHMLLGHHQQALVVGREALELNQRLGARYGEAHTWATIGLAQKALGRFAEAAVSQRHAHGLFAELGDRTFEATALGYLADIHEAAGEPRAALAARRRALAILRGLKHPDAVDLRAQLAARVAAASGAAGETARDPAV
jgi:DNA-binding SARP family transcriptional activator/tetratricopeptide (TPR) repeat protein